MGGADTRLAVIEINTGIDYHAILPGARGTPELDEVIAPITVVVYEDGWPGPITGLPGTNPRARAPGTWDVCVTRTDGGDIGGLPFIVYANVKADGSPITAR
jgi:hypothetical protein